MRPGSMRVSVEVQQPTTSRGTTGEELLTWATVVTRRAAMRVQKAVETERAGIQTAAVVRHQFRLRYENALADMTPKWRIKIDARLFDVESVINVLNKNRDLIITAIEQT